MKVNFGVFLLVVFAVATYTGWDWPNIAKIMPVYVAAIPGLLMIVIQLYREVYERAAPFCGLVQLRVAEIVHFGAATSDLTRFPIRSCLS